MKTKRFILTAAAIAMIFLIMTGCLIDPQMMMRYQQQYGQNNSVFSSAGSGSYNAEQSQIQTMTQANGGETPLIASAEEEKTPCLIEGRYTNKQVTSYQTAIESLCDVNAVMGIENPTREFAGESINEYNGSKFYKLQQKYNGIDVYGKQLIVTTDNYGSTQSLTGNYEKLENVATTPRIDVRTAAQAAAQELGSAVTSMPETVIYALDQTPELAYVFEEPSCSIIISAQTGKVIDNISNIYTSNEDNWEIPKVLRDGKYWLEDTKRGIIIKGSLERENSINKNDQIIQSVLDNASPITAPENGGRFEIENKIGMEDYSSTDAIKLYHFLIVANDYYLKKVGIKPFSNQDDTVYGYINDGYYGGKNGYSSTIRQNGKFVTRIVIGFDMEITADLVGHEYTHSVEGTVSNMFYSNESGAIMEAYSDVMGELIEEYEWGWADWVHNSRKLNNPSSNGKPSKYLDDNYYNGKYDNGGVHHNSTVISHAMYKIHNSGMVTSDELARMMYRSLMYISSGCTFSELYGALLASAKRMNLSSGAIREINKCFEDANISLKQYDEGNHVSGRVVDASKNPIPNVIISFTPAEGESGDKAVVTTGADGRFSLMIPSGIYKMKIEKGNKIGYFCRKIEIDKVIQVIDINEQTENEFGDIVFNVTEKKDGVIAGKVIDAVTHRPISGATIKIREGADVTSGDYMKSNVIYGSVGNGYADIVCTTDKRGFYNFNTIPLEDDEDVIILVLNENNSIPYGMYTLEVTAEGYEKTYLTVRSSAIYTEEDLESYKNQNIEMKPISTNSTTAYDASLYIPYVEAAIRDTQDYFYDDDGHRYELEPYSYGNLYDITGDGIPELFTLRNVCSAENGTGSLIEIFTQKDGKVEKIYKRLSYGTTADDTVELTSIEIYSGATELYGDTVLIFCCRADYGDSFYIYGIDKYSGYLFLERYYILEYDMNEIDYVVISVKMGDGGGNEKFIGEDEFKKWWSSLKLEKNIFFDDDVQTLSDLLRQLKS